MHNKLKVGITHGDINGIGYEVILKALEDSQILEMCTPIIYGSAKIAMTYRKQLQLGQMQFNQIESPAQARHDVINIINVVGEDVRPEPGNATAEAGRAAFESLERAVADIKAGRIDVLVTAPINKSTIQGTEFKFAGHTEYLESACGEDARALMILFNEYVRVALLTTHTPIAQVAQTVTAEAVVARLKEFNASLQRDFAVHAPRVAVLGLNPHAGDNGLLGNEERDVIIPAIAQARDEGVMAFGPYAADGFFGAGLYKTFDGVLAMYHDQGLGPLKTLSMDGVNFTAGLPFVRTSPDHGTGMDIAGKGEASARSMREAIYAAIDIRRNRQVWDDCHRSPLKRQYYEKGPDNVVLDLSGE